MPVPWAREPRNALLRELDCERSYQTGGLGWRRCRVPALGREQGRPNCRPDVAALSTLGLRGLAEKSQSPCGGVKAEDVTPQKPACIQEAEGPSEHGPWVPWACTGPETRASVGLGLITVTLAQCESQVLERQCLFVCFSVLATLES